MDQLRISGIREHVNTESDIRELSAQKKGERRTLVLPLELEGQAIGGLTSTIQVVATWAAQQPEGQRVVQIDARVPKDKNALNSILANDHLLIGCLFADQVLDNSGADITSRVRHATDLIHKNSERSDTLAIEPRLLALDTSGSSRLSSTRLHGPRSSPDYSEAPTSGRTSTLLGPIEATLGAINARLWLGRSAGIDNQDDVSDWLQDLLFELIHNSYRWGSFKLIAPDRAHEIPESVRYFRAEYLEASSGVLSNNAGHNDPYQEYIVTSLTPLVLGSGKRGVDYPAKVLELSFFDNGEGLFYWMAADNRPLVGSVSFAEEKEFTAAALRKGSGSRKTFLYRSGQGIPSALKAISALKGFVHLRTGRLALYRDFAEEPLTELEDKPTSALLETGNELRYFRDWATRDTSDLTPNEFIRGTSYTVLLPLLDEDMK